MQLKTLLKSEGITLINKSTNVGEINQRSDLRNGSTLKLTLSYYKLNGF